MNVRGPDFDELVGADLPPEERERLLRVHELLIAAGPPPDFDADVPPVPDEAKVVRLRRRRRPFALVALAAALALAVFGAGFFVGDRSSGPDAVVAMGGTGEAAGASASLELYSPDEAGNWPMRLEVKGLKPGASGRSYELWLTKDSKLAAFCGSFRAEPDGTTIVRLNAPYRLSDFSAWVVVEEGSKALVLTT